MRCTRVCLAVLVLLGPPAAAQRVRDSAGIRIVENSRPALAANRMWRISPAHFLQIPNSESDDSVYELLRVMGVARLSDGRIAVANQGTNTIRFFDSAGKYLGAFGRSGEGPGEFLQVLGLRVIRGDSVVVPDVNRINYYSAQGGFARSIATSATGMRIYAVSLLPDGSYLGFSGRRAIPTQPRGGRWTDSATLFRVGPGPAERDSIGHFPSHVVSYSAAARGPVSVVFGPWLKVAAGERDFYVGFPSRNEIVALTPAGKTIRVVRWSAPARRTTSAAIEAHRTWMINRPGEDGRPAPERMRQYWSQLAEQTEFAEQLPAFSTLLVDRTAHLWVREYEPQEEFYQPGPISIRTIAKPTRWDVFTPEGRWLGRIELPASFTPLEIGADYVAGLWRDRDDVEHVRFYRLLKP